MLTAALAQALAYQAQSLQAVSRTFALTIPQLPETLRDAVGNGYLLCRIADTIEDDPDLPWEKKAYWQAEFLKVVEGAGDATAFAAAFGADLSAAMPEAEHDLIRHTPEVVAITHSFTLAQRSALSRCVRIMGMGMAEFQQHASLQGLADMAEMDRYCYVVAGVVGEMLTSLFVDMSRDWRRMMRRCSGLRCLWARFTDDQYPQGYLG
jgi:farnesyl-diphosphate farnesyltransferase (EC 2.5.1.21)